VITVINQSVNTLLASSNGGTYPYIYSWSTGSTQSSISLTSPGLYWLISNDNNSCLSDTVFYDVSCITSYKTDSVIACDNFTWVNGVTYNTSITGVSHVLQATDGCDSVLTLNLVIENSSFDIIDSIVCDSLNWLGEYLSTSGTYTDTLTNAVGCDSVVTMNFYIYHGFVSEL
jgi:hypothetical protein